MLSTSIPIYHIISCSSCRYHHSQNSFSKFINRFHLESNWTWISKYTSRWKRIIAKNYHNSLASVTSPNTAFDRRLIRFLRCVWKVTFPKQSHALCSCCPSPIHTHHLAIPIPIERSSSDQRSRDATSWVEHNASSNSFPIRNEEDVPSWTTVGKRKGYNRTWWHRPSTRVPNILRCVENLEKSNPIHGRNWCGERSRLSPRIYLIYT